MGCRSPDAIPDRADPFGDDRSDEQTTLRWRLLTCVSLGPPKRSTQLSTPLLHRGVIYARSSPLALPAVTFCATVLSGGSNYELGALLCCRSHSDTASFEVIGPDHAPDPRFTQAYPHWRHPYGRFSWPGNISQEGDRSALAGSVTHGFLGFVQITGADPGTTISGLSDTGVLPGRRFQPLIPGLAVAIWALTHSTSHDSRDPSGLTLARQPGHSSACNATCSASAELASCIPLRTL